MARIRSIKPETWTDEKIVSLSPFARLLFIGMWNFADDEGRMPYSPITIKLQVLPADSIEISELLGEIRGKGMIAIYQVDGKEYLQIVNFDKHQKVDKRTPSKYPPPPDAPPNSTESPRITPTEGNGGEGNGGEGNGGEKHSGDLRSPPCPFDEIVSLYHEALPSLPKLKVLSETRKSHIRARWREYPDLDDWREFFRRVNASKFLMGRVNGTEGRPPFVADLPWLIKPENFAKVLEGKYARGR